jgi:hypothetical protein
LTIVAEPATITEVTSNHSYDGRLFEVADIGEHGLPAGRLDAQRLVDKLGGAYAAARLFGLDVRSVQRWTTWSYAKADAMSIRAGLHPKVVWPESWDADLEDDDDG